MAQKGETYHKVSSWRNRQSWAPHFFPSVRFQSALAVHHHHHHQHRGWREWEGLSIQPTLSQPFHPLCHNFQFVGPIFKRLSPDSDSSGWTLSKVKWPVPGEVMVWWMAKRTQVCSRKVDLLEVHSLAPSLSLSVTVRRITLTTISVPQIETMVIPF